MAAARGVPPLTAAGVQRLCGVRGLGARRARESADRGAWRGGGPAYTPLPSPERGAQPGRRLGRNSWGARRGRASHAARICAAAVRGAAQRS